MNISPSDDSIENTPPNQGPPKNTNRKRAYNAFAAGSSSRPKAYGNCN